LGLTAPPGDVVRREQVDELVERARAGDREAFASLVGLTRFTHWSSLVM
jgi:hypothetical protein